MTRPGAIAAAALLALAVGGCEHRCECVAADGKRYRSLTGTVGLVVLAECECPDTEAPK